MIDINEVKAKGEALDIRSARHVPFTRAAMKTQRIPTSSSSRPALPVSPARPDWTSHRRTSTSSRASRRTSRSTHRMQSICSSATRLISSPIRSASAPAFRSPASSVPVPSSIPPVCVHVSPSTTRLTSRTYTLTFWASTATALSCRGPLRTSPTFRQTHTRRLWKTPTAC